ncbi:MAG TPA: hypothetical protein VJY34_14830 [Roseiarcus sp.]|nr:hypothetical protein [Roseiarcus sp.]
MADQIGSTPVAGKISDADFCNASSAQRQSLARSPRFDVPCRKNLEDAS